jgi:transcriptional regulator with XRE-family HTH domain
MRKNDATVNIDGAAIKRIREQQELTQLYVAKVVGVTTDTISRWENNRYPTIKRLNAQRLAEALEVDLEQIVSAPVVDQGQLPVLPPKKITKMWVSSLLVVIAATVFAWFWLLQPAQITAERILPSYAAPGAIIPVQLRLRGDGVRGVVRETLPGGCTLVGAIPAPASVDIPKGLLRWVVKLNAEPTYIYYLVQVDSQASLNSMIRFDGALVAHGATGSERVELLGANQLVIANIHWADLNGDYVIDDDEIIEASSLYENMPELPLDLDSVEEIWIEDNYYWDEMAHVFIPGLAPKVEEASDLGVN